MSQSQLERLASEIFDLTKLSTQARYRARVTAPDTLTETEHLTLDLLSRTEVMSVGEIQRAIGVLPAQMSRIVRALEDKSGKALIACAINPEDRRRIDVSLTRDGKKALDQYRKSRTEFTIKVLGELSPDDLDHFTRVLRKIQTNISNQLS